MFRYYNNSNNNNKKSKIEWTWIEQIIINHHYKGEMTFKKKEMSMTYC